MSRSTRLHVPIGVASLVALLPLGLAACGATVVDDGDRGACAATCEERNPEGLQFYEVVSSECVCMGCSDACTQSVCRDKETPSAACLPCVQASLEGAACNEHAGLFGSGCLGHDSCQKFVSCLEACGH